MASAKFLEEALSTDVDESAVSAIVGSLETQLGNSSDPSPVTSEALESKENHIENNIGTVASDVNNGANNATDAVIDTNVITNTECTSAISNSVISNAVVAQKQQQLSVVQQPPPPSPPSVPTPQIQSSVPSPEKLTITTPPVTVSSIDTETQKVNGPISTEQPDLSNSVSLPRSEATTKSPPNTQVMVVQTLPPPPPSTQIQQQQQIHQQQAVQQIQHNQISQQIQTQPLQQITSAIYSGVNTVSVASVAGTPLTKVQQSSGEHVKIVYANQGNHQQQSQQQQQQVIGVTSSGVVSANGKIAFPAQSVAQLANGTLGVVTTHQSVLSHQQQTSQPPSPQIQQQGQLNVTQGKQPLVIKTTGAPSGMVQVPMSLPVSMASGVNVVSSTTPGNKTQVVPSNLQLLNMNTMRPGTPVAAQQPGKQTVGSRVVINPQLMGARPGTPGITLQTLQALQAGTAGHLLLKTENGQFQLLRVGPAPTSGTPGAATPNSIPSNSVVGVPPPGTTYRLASVPATVATTVSSATTTSAATPAIPSTTPSAPATPVHAAQTTPQRPASDNTKEKCRKFLANLLELSSREPRAVERNVRTLIQELIDCKVEPEEFCVRLERLLNASPQPCLIGFLKKSLPLLRQSLVTKEMVIDGIRAPPPHVVFSIANSTQMQQQQNQIRPSLAPTSVPTVVTPSQSVGQLGPHVGQAPISTPAVAPTVNQQVRVMAPLTGVTNLPRPPQSTLQQQRMTRPATTIIRTQSTFTAKTAPAVSSIRPTTPVIQKSTTLQSIKSVHTSAVTSKGVPTIIQNKVIVPSSQPKQIIIKEKEKKTFSSAGYTGDDDINDVAAMGGVNLAEESQKILGSTKFVGTQIRSCKDEVFLHLSPLQQKINSIVNSYGLDEPNPEVASLISHAAQERLKNLIEKLAVIAEHRIDLNKADPRYEITQDVRAQLKFLEELDRVERKKHEEQEREVLLKVAKSRAKTEDPEQAKLKAKAKEMQRAEMEELRQREANLTALQAIGPRKKPKLDNESTLGNSNNALGLNSVGHGLNRQITLRPRIKRVNYRDLLFLLEQEKDTCRSTTLYKSYLK